MVKHNRGIIVFFVVLSAFISWSASFIIHNPLTSVFLNNFGFKYSDIIYGVLNPRFQVRESRVDTYWYRVDKLKQLESGEMVMVFPYIDFKLEYPPIIGLLYFISINFAYRFLNSCGGLGNYTCYMKFVYLNYIVHSFVILAFHISTALVLTSILKEKGYSLLRILLFTQTFSAIIYLIYNWDIICSFFTILAVYLYVKRKLEPSALALGLATLTKIVPILLAIVFTVIYILNFLKKKIGFGELKRYIYGFLVTFLATTTIPFALIYVANPASVMDFYKHHSDWYCENCIYQVFERNVFSERHKLYSAIALTVALASSIIIFYKDYVIEEFIWKHAFLVTISFIALSYITSPQMMLLATPLIPVVKDSFVERTYLKADLLNAIAILLFFKDRELRECLAKLGFGIEVSFNPWVIPSPTQITFLLRNTLLIIIVIYIFLRVIQRRKV